jgi:hypothetical protein
MSDRVWNDKVYWETGDVLHGTFPGSCNQKERVKIRVTSDNIQNPEI